LEVRLRSKKFAAAAWLCSMCHHHTLCCECCCRLVAAAYALCRSWRHVCTCALSHGGQTSRHTSMSCSHLSALCMCPPPLPLLLQVCCWQQQRSHCSSYEGGDVPHSSSSSGTHSGSSSSQTSHQTAVLAGVQQQALGLTAARLALTLGRGP
jgi:hypothetical protein